MPARRACGSGEDAVQGVHRGEAQDVLIGVAPRERVCGCAAAVADLAAVPELRDQPGHLLARAAGDLAQVAHHQPLLGPGGLEVPEVRESLRGEAVGGLAGLGLEFEAQDAVEKRPNLLQRMEPLNLKSHDHPPMIPTPAGSLQTHLCVETQPALQTHVSLDKTPGGGSNPFVIESTIGVREVHSD